MDAGSGQGTGHRRRSAGWFAALNASHPRWFDTDTPVAALSRRRRAAFTSPSFCEPDCVQPAGRFGPGPRPARRPRRPVRAVNRSHLSCWATAAIATAVLLTSCAGRPHTTALRLPLHPAGQLQLPGGADRFDYQAIDAGRRRLFASHMGSDQIVVVDLNGPTTIGTIADVPQVTGVLAVGALGRVFASVAASDELRVYDEDTLALLGRVPTGEFPDGISYDPDAGRVYVSDEHGGDLTVADARTAAPITRIPLGGQAGNNRYDPTTHLVLVDVQTRDQLVVVDPATYQVTRRVPLPGCHHDHGLLLDPDARRAYVACDGNNRLLVVDVDHDRVLQDFPLGDGPDVLAADPGLHRLYAAAESGDVAVFTQTATGTLTPDGLSHLADNAHTVAVDPATHLVYFPVPDLHGHPTLLVMKPT